MLDGRFILDDFDLHLTAAEPSPPPCDSALSSAERRGEDPTNPPEAWIDSLQDHKTLRLTLDARVILVDFALHLSTDKRPVGKDDEYLWASDPEY